MRAVVQRVDWARVKVDGAVVGEIGRGLLVLLGAGEQDGDQDVAYLANKVIHLRIFEDDNQLMNRSVLETAGELLVVSQFTLFGDCRKGRRPSFVAALEPGQAADLCNRFVSCCRAEGVPVQTGQFGAMMEVELCNNGPVTLLLDSKKLF